MKKSKVAKGLALAAVGVVAWGALAPTMAVAEKSTWPGQVAPVQEPWLSSIMADSKCGPGLQSVPSFWPILFPIPDFLCPGGRATPAEDALAAAGVVGGGITPVPQLPVIPDLTAQLPALPNPVSEFSDALQDKLTNHGLVNPAVPNLLGKPLDVSGLPLFGGDDKAEDQADGAADGHFGPIQLVQGIQMNSPVADGGTAGVVASPNSLNISSDTFSAEGFVLRGAGVVQTSKGPEKVLVMQAKHATLRNYKSVANGLTIYMTLEMDNPTFYLRRITGDLKLGLLPDIIPALRLTLTPQLIPIALPVGLPLGPITNDNMSGDAALITSGSINYSGLKLEALP